MEKKETATKKAVKEVKTTDKKVEEFNFKGKYNYAVGRRKTSVAQVRLYKNGKGVFIVNGKTFLEYFTENVANSATQPLELTGLLEDSDLSVVVAGGGKKAQADAVRHGVSRALLLVNEELKPSLKAKGWLTRDARSKERKKPGLKKARKAPQWSKR